jgi:hypothetical protein
MQATGLRVFCHRDPFGFGEVDFLLRGTEDFGRLLIQAHPIVFESKDIKDYLGERQAPSFSLKADNTQLLMDELWRIGFRPTEGHGSVGQLGAVEKHLADMRALVFKTPPPK